MAALENKRTADALEAVFGGNKQGFRAVTAQLLSDWSAPIITGIRYGTQEDKLQSSGAS